LTRTPSAPDPWIAEIEVSEERAAALIAPQFPALAPVGLERIGEGWDNAAFIVNGAYVFRFPRRTISAKLIEIEVGVLPLIGGHVPLPVPVPALVGAPTSDYPWPFAGYAKLQGTPLSAMRSGEEAYERLAPVLGTFLRALHAVDREPLLAAGLPSDEIGRFDYERTIDKLTMRLHDLYVAGLVDNGEAILDFAEGLRPIAPRPAHFTVVHGDLYARHILVSDELEPAAVIDWGDVHFGEPAIDLTLAYSLIPAAFRGEFFAAYGSADESARRLARYRAIYHSAMVAHYGHRIDDADLVYIGLRGLRLALL
jgi:aminoglycoside phosphotransferase (APT) family kinase protein